MATETNLAKVNVFSTKALYDANAASLGADEISLVPVDEIAVSTGFILPFAGTSVPDGWLPCDGAEVSRITYAKLFAAIGTTYGVGNGSTTFNLPNLNNGSFLEGSNTAGTVKSAGLPNITGSHGVSTDTNANPSLISGAFSYSSASGAHGGDCDQGTGQIIFDASKSNAIYGGSDTVQPKSVTVKFCIKY